MDIFCKLSSRFDFDDNGMRSQVFRREILAFFICIAVLQIGGRSTRFKLKNYFFVVLTPMYSPVVFEFEDQIFAIYVKLLMRSGQMLTASFFIIITSSTQHHDKMLLAKGYINIDEGVNPYAPSSPLRRSRVGC